MESNWTTPQVTKYDDLNKPWFVWFRYNGKLKVYKKGINYIQNYSEREKAAKALRDVLYKKLKSGWVPVTQSIFLDNSMTLLRAVEFAMAEKKQVLAPRTYESYETAAKYFCEAIRKMKLENFKLSETKRLHVRSVFAEAASLRNWSNKAYNKNLGYMKAIFSALIDCDIIEQNPFHKIKSRKVEHTEANTTLTDEEIETVKNRIEPAFKGFWNYISFIFHTGARPNEVYQLQISMIDLENDIIRMPPDITKTALHRNVTITKQLKELLISLNLQNYSDDHYLFGSLRAGKNRPVHPDTDFVPAPKMLTRDSGSDQWNKIVKKELGINKNMYSMKHLGGDKKLLAGIELDAIREQYGHTNKRMTERYVKALKEVNKRQIIALSPNI